MEVDIAEYIPQKTERLKNENMRTKQTYLLIITGASGNEIKRVVCTSKAQAKRECEAMYQYLATGNLFEAKYDDEQDKYVPVKFVKRIRI